MSSNELFQLVALSIVLLVSAMHKDKALFIFNVAIRYAFLPVMIIKVLSFVLLCIPFLCGLPHYGVGACRLAVMCFGASVGEKLIN